MVNLNLVEKIKASVTFLLLLSAMFQLKQYKKLILLVLSLLLILVVYVFMSAGHGQKVDFQEYRPTYLPAGLEAKNGQFYVLKDKGAIPSFKKHINVSLNSPNSWLAEWKSDGQLTNRCSNFPGNKDCNTYTTKDGQNYQLTIATNTDRYVYDLRFIKHGTEIWITLRDTNVNITTDEWGKVVESFQPTHFQGLKVVRGSSAGP